MKVKVPGTEVRNVEFSMVSNWVLFGALSSTILTNKKFDRYDSVNIS